MKQPNPLVPQGTFESQARGKSHVRIAVFTILAIHVVVLGALLIQGCKRDKDEGADAASTTDTNAIPPFGDTNAIVSSPLTTNTNPPVPPATGFTAAPTGAAPAAPTIPSVTPTTPFVPTVTPSAPAGVGSSMVDGAPTTEHVIVKGDTFDSIARKYGVTVKAIQAANPNLSPTRLKLGDKVKVPAKTSNGTAASVSPAAVGSSDTYVVKAGDTLGKIAKAHGVTVKELQKLNNLSTTQIRVSQKLKVPQRAAASAATPNPATPGGAAPAPSGTPAPAQ
jgi:LysM repeat protein